MDDVPNLIDATDAKGWADHLNQQIGPGGKAVVIVDTWQRATARASQSDDGEMQKAIKNADVISKHVNGPMIVACHPPKGKNGVVIGSSIIENDTAAILEITKKPSSETRDVLVLRAKGFREGMKCSYGLEVVGFSRKDENGNERTGAVAVPTGLLEQEADAAGRELKIQAEIIRDVLEDVKASGETYPISKEKLAKILSGTSYGNYEFPSLSQTKRRLESAFGDQPYEFEDGAVLVIAQHGRKWRCEIKPPEIEIPVSSVTGGEEPTADIPTV
jgi:hypothetical protein